MKWWKQRLIISLALTLLLGGVTNGVAPGDPSSSSTNFRLNESEIGGAGDFDASSSSFRLQPGTDNGGGTLGEAAVGNSSSTNFQSTAGFNTTAEPALTMVVNNGAIDLGVLSTTVAQTATATFWVKNYTSYGYVVQIVGASPTNSGHQLTPITTASCGANWGCASTAGAEQFGLNVVANTSPVAVGANPVQDPELPSNGFGAAGNGITGSYGSTRPYTVNGRYRFVSGETVASAPKSSGKTTYTLSFLANISNTTPGGKYSGNLDIVATGTY